MDYQVRGHVPSPVLRQHSALMNVDEPALLALDQYVMPGAGHNPYQSSILLSHKHPAVLLQPLVGEEVGASVECQECLSQIKGRPALQIDQGVVVVLSSLADRVHDEANSSSFSAGCQ